MDTGSCEKRTSARLRRVSAMLRAWGIELPQDEIRKVLETLSADLSPDDLRRRERPVLAAVLADRICSVHELVETSEDEEAMDRAIKRMRRLSELFKGLIRPLGRELADRIEKSRQHVRAQIGDRPHVEHLDLAAFVQILESSGRDHSDGYYQYTQWSSLIKMMRGLRLPSGEHGRFLFLTSVKATNDGVESFWSARDYIASFSYSKYEDVSMWLNYGRRSKDAAAAVRIHFDRDAMKRWAAEFVCPGRPLQAGSVFGLVNGPRGGRFRLEDLSGQVESVRMADVGYVIHSRYMTGHHGGNIEYRRKFYRVTSSNRMEWSDRIYDRCPGTDLLPVFKKRGWAYEREVRLVVRLKESAQLDRYRRVAIRFDQPFAKLEEELLSPRNDRGPVWRFPLLSGPWFDADKKLARLHLGPGQSIALADAYRSDYAAEIRVIS